MTPEEHIMTALKQRTLARLHAERAHLLWELVGLSAAQLGDESFSAEKHRIQDLFPHIAKWDAFEANRLAMMQDGRLAEIESIEVDEANATWFEQHHSLTLDQAVAMLLKERNGFVNVVKEIADADFEREVTLPFGRKLTVASELAMQAQHDADHMHDIAAWKARHGIVRNSVGPQAVLLASLRASCRALLALVALVPADERETRPVHGSWTLKELLAHIVGWDRYAVEGIHTGGWPPLPDGVTDIPSFNDHSVASRQAQTWQMIWTELIDTRRELLMLIERMAQSDLDTVFGEPARGETMYQWLLIWLHHELEHSAELRIALAIPNTPEHLTYVSQ